MQGAIRSCLTAGIALVGVGVITVAPVAPRLPEIQVSSMPTPSGPGGGLSADLAGAWLRVFEHGGIENLSQYGASVVADSAAGLRQLIATEFDYAPMLTNRNVTATQDFAAAGLPAEFRPVMEALAQGDVVSAGNALNTAALVTALTPTEVLLDVLRLPGQFTDKLTNVIGAVINVNNLVTIGTGAVGPVQAVWSATVDSGQAVFAAINAGDNDAAVNTLIAAPAAIANAFLNGYTNGNGIHYPGIFTVDTENPSAGGLLQTLFVTLPRIILTALGYGPNSTVDSAAAVTERATAAPELDATSVTDVPGGKGTSGTTGNATHRKRTANTVPADAAPREDAPTESTTTTGGGTKAASEVKGGNKIAEPKRPSASNRPTVGSSSGATKASASRDSGSSAGD